MSMLKSLMELKSNEHDLAIQITISIYLHCLFGHVMKCLTRFVT